MNNTRYVVLTCLFLTTVACTPEATRTETAETDRGAEILAPLKTELKQALVAGMQQGPLNAISVCKERAPAIAESLSIDGVEIGRTSHRLRNPANVAPGWVTEVLTDYLNDGSDLTPRVVRLSDNRKGYVEPIMLQPLCVTCHGKTLAPDIAAHIKEAYPADEATGFEVGDLRGVYWVAYSATK